MRGLAEAQKAIKGTIAVVVRANVDQRRGSTSSITASNTELGKELPVITQQLKAKA